MAALSKLDARTTMSFTQHTAQTASELASASQLAQTGRVDLALDIYRRILDRDNGCAEAWYRKGLLHRENGDTQLAITALRQSMVLRPSDPWPYFQLAQMICSTGIGRRLESVELFRHALALDPGCHEFRLNLGNALAAMHALGEAAHVLAPLPAALPSWWAAARDNAIHSWRSRRNEARALLALRRNNQVRKLSLAQHLRLARLLAMLGRSRTALELARQTMREHPHTWESFALYAEILAQRDGPSSAAQFLDSIDWLFGGSIPFELMLARYRYESTANESAWSALTPAVRSSSQEARALASSVLLTMQYGDALLNHCREWIHATPDDTAPYMFAIAAQRTRGALRSFSEAPVAESPRPQIAKDFTLVQFWDSDIPPAEIQQAMASWHDMHPELRHAVYSERTARDYLAQHYDANAVACFDWCHHAAMKSDVFRIAFLAREGGVYIDADEFCRRPLHPLLRELDTADLIAALSADVAPYIYNAFLIAKRGAPALQLTLRGLLDGLGNAMRAGHHPDIWHATGPGILTRTIGGLLASDHPFSASLLLLTKGQYASFSEERDTMAYKQTRAGNWRLSAASA